MNSDQANPYVGLFDFDGSFDVALFESLVLAASSPKGQSPAQFQHASETLKRFCQAEQSGTHVSGILHSAQHDCTRRCALHVIQELVALHWDALSGEQKDQVRDQILDTINRLSSDPDILSASYSVLDKANGVLISIALQDWPARWPNFLSAMISKGSDSASKCENALLLLKLLSEVLFEGVPNIGKEQDTAAQQRACLHDGSRLFLQLCMYASSLADSTPVSKALLSFLSSFVKWMPESALPSVVDMILAFLPKNHLALQCLTEIALRSSPEDIPANLAITFDKFIDHFARIVPLDSDLNALHASNPRFLQQTVFFLVTFLSRHLRLVETDHYLHRLHHANKYLVKVFETFPRSDLFRTILDYWMVLCEDLLQKPRKVHQEVLAQVRTIIAKNMTCPVDFLVRRDQNLTDSLNPAEQEDYYRVMKTVMIYLTPHGVEATMEMLKTALEEQSPPDWNLNVLSRLCWSAACISTCLTEDQEKTFFIFVIKKLLTNTEMAKGRENRSFLAANIMHVVSHYPRFLRKYWRFLKTVICKLFEFLHETYPGVQDMACETILKIVKQTAPCFVVIQPSDDEPYLVTILKDLPQLISALSPPQICVFYSAIAHLISASSQPRLPLVAQLMDMPNKIWKEIAIVGAQDPRRLRSVDALKKIDNILKTCIAGCERVGAAFCGQMDFMYPSMVGLYQLYLEDTVWANQTGNRTHFEMKARTVVKRDLVKLLCTYLSFPDGIPHLSPDLLRPWLFMIMEDYKLTLDFETLTAFSMISTHCAVLIRPDLQNLIEKLVEPTLNYLKLNVEDTHRWSIFFQLLRALTKNCLSDLVRLPPEKLKIFMDSLEFSIRSPTSSISRAGLDVLSEMLGTDDDDFVDRFYPAWCVVVVKLLLEVSLDGAHKSDMPQQSKVLFEILVPLQEGLLTVSLDPDQSPSPSSNITYLKNCAKKWLGEKYPKLEESDVRDLVHGLEQTSARDLETHLTAFGLKLSDK